MTFSFHPEADAEFREDTLDNRQDPQSPGDMAGA